METGKLSWNRGAMGCVEPVNVHAGLAWRHNVFDTSSKRGTQGVTALALVTAGLLLAGCASKGSNTGSGGTPPKLLIGTGSSGSVAAPMMAAGAIAPANGAALAPQPAPGHMGMFGGFVLTGTLPDHPTHAPIYVWQAGKAAQADVVRLATALGLIGTPTRHAHGWELTTSTGDLRVRDGSGENWSYERADTISCPNYQIDIDNPDGAETGVACAFSSANTQAPPQGPDEAATKAAAASLLASIGVSGDEQFNVSSPASTLTVAPQVDGMPTQGIETNVDVDSRGIKAASGRLDAPKAGTDYPLQTAKAAFDSLANRPEPMIAQYCGPVMRGGPIPGPIVNGPMASGPNVKGPIAAPAAPTVAPSPSDMATPNTVLVASPPPAPVSGAPASPPDLPVSSPPPGSPYTCPTPEPQKVTGAVLGLQLEYDATGSGSNILVPAWFFTVADSTYPTTVIAVDPSFLGEQAVPPMGRASAVTGSGGGAAGSAVAVPPQPPQPAQPPLKTSPTAAPAS
jgi:hypothetical protein